MLKFNKRNSISLGFFSFVAMALLPTLAHASLWNKYAVKGSGSYFKSCREWDGTMENLLGGACDREDAVQSLAEARAILMRKGRQVCKDEGKFVAEFKDATCMVRAPMGFYTFIRCDAEVRCQ